MSFVPVVWAWSQERYCWFFSFLLCWSKHLSEKLMELLKLIHPQLPGFFFFFWYEFNMLGKEPPAMGKAVDFLFPA